MQKTRGGGGNSLKFRVKSCGFLSGGRVSSRAVGGSSSSGRLGGLFSFIFSIALLFGTGGAWAADWTVSENTTLTADTTVDALTVNSDVTLNLNGYKLYCTSLSGSGTITSTGLDLTEPGGTFTMVSPSATKNGSVAKLFNNNNTYRYSDPVQRIMLDQTVNDQKLPFIVDYDFGEGNEKVVDAYKIYGGKGVRSPSAWVLYGSNSEDAYDNASDDNWVQIDERSGMTNWTHDGSDNTTADSRSYTCGNTTAYRYYRLKVTARNGGDNFFEMVQLEYFKSGELHLNVAGSATWPASITFSGNIKVVKEGSGTLESSAILDMNDGTFVIAAGTVRSSGNFRLATVIGKTVNVEVAEGGTLYSGGVLAIGCGGTATLTVNGGTVYSSGDMFTGNNASGSGTLTINSGTVEVVPNKILALSHNGTGTLNLNGGMLKTKCIKKTGGTSSMLNFDGGTLQANAEITAYFIEGLTGVKVKSGGGTIDVNGHSVKISKTIEGAGAMRFKGGGTITFSYDCKHEGGTTIELGTKVSMTADSTTTILNNLVIDGRAVLEAKTYDVFLKSGQTEEATNNITLVNCAVGSMVGFDNDETPTKITVTLAEPTCVNTTTPIMAFPGKTLDEIKYADFTSRMLGQYANNYNALDSAKGCNKKFYYDGDGNLSSIVVEFQASDGANIRCVVVEFTDGEGGVYAKALGARYQANASLGFVFLKQDKTTWNGVSKVVAISRAEAHYGVCDFRYTMGETPDAEWMLDADKTWSALRNGATLADGDIVRITVVNADAVLTVDEDVNVGRIEFVSGSGATLQINSGYTVTAENISGIGNIANDGTVVKTGAGEATFTFNRDYAGTGVTIVSNGTLKVSKTGTGDMCHKVRVASGATLDVDGNCLSLDVTLEDGAYFVNNGSSIPNNYQQINSLTLEGDATMTANGNFGIIAPSEKTTYLNLGSHTLYVNAASGKEFCLNNTTITGDGTIAVTSGRFVTRNHNSTGANCTISVDTNGIFENNKHFTVSNFVNNGTISYASNWGRGVLEVTGRFESKAANFPRLTLTGATVKAEGSHITVLDNFETSGTITIDASAITRQQLKDAGDVGIPIFTVPTANKGGNWNVVKSSIPSVRAKWKDTEDGATTLYLRLSEGMMIIIR